MLMTYCLLCGEHSDGDISPDDVYEWQDDHEADVHYTEAGGHKRGWYQHVSDGQEVIINSRSEVGGFAVGQIVKPSAEWQYGYDWSEPTTITGFVIYGYQGILATVKVNGQERVVYLDQAEVVGDAALDAENRHPAGYR